LKTLLAPELADICQQFEEDLLRDIARRDPVTVKEIERHRVHAVLVEIVKLAESNAIPASARFEELRVGLVIGQIDHPDVRRSIDGFSSKIFRSVFCRRTHFIPPRGRRQADESDLMSVIIASRGHQ